MDSASENRLSKVHPLLAEKVRKLIAALFTATGVEYRIVQGLRTYAEQDALFAKRPKVTNARGGFSNHNFGLAVDLCPFVDGEFAWNADKLFNEIGKQIHALGGLEWGGDWKFVDKPHVQLPGLTVLVCRELYAKGGLALVWKRVDEINHDIAVLDFADGVTHDLKFGDKGADVRALQVKLGITVDGDFGRGTEKAVKEFQHKNGLTSDGIVGQNTRQKLGL